MKMTRLILILAVALLLIPGGVALAATTQTVAVTATPGRLSISNAPATKAFGTIDENTTVWALGSTPADPLVDGGCTFTVTNDGNKTANIGIQATNFTGGTGWTLAGTVGSNQVVMKAGKSGGTHAAMIVVTTGGQAFITGLAGAATKKWEFKLDTGTFTDTVEKSSTITLTATAG